jgi:hypothetical protein
MQREIKFRLWGEQSGVMHHFNLQSDKITMNSRGLWVSDGNHSAFIGGGNPLMQFTGVKDKDGKEIYEGDILQGDVWNGPVLFHEGRFVVDVSKPALYMPVRDLAHRDFVIGNIYENPELLTV